MNPAPFINLTIENMWFNKLNKKEGAG